MKLDHIMFSAPDLNQGIALVEKLTGVAPVFGGSHPGNGTHNALLSLGEDQYLEVIAPDPKQEHAGTMAEEFLRLPPHIHQWAVATDGFAGLKGALGDAGFGHRVIDMSRTTPDGVHLAWQILFVADHPFGLAMPFFIDWLQSPHPAGSTPKGCLLEGFSIQCPLAGELQAFFGSINLKADIQAGDLAMSASIQAPAGAVRLA